MFFLTLAGYPKKFLVYCPTPNSVCRPDSFRSCPRYSHRSVRYSSLVLGSVQTPSLAVARYGWVCMRRNLDDEAPSLWPWTDEEVAFVNVAVVVLVIMVLLVLVVVGDMVFFL